MTLDKSAQVSLTFDTYYNTIVSLGLTIMNSAQTVIEKMNILRLSPYKCIRNQI